VADDTVAKIGGFEPHGILSGPVLGATWDDSDDPFNPTRGQVITFDFLQAGVPWGGQYTFWRGTAEGK
jgi:outer membrane protein assembly factor BamA